jgi:hypothetical protein
MHQYDVPRYLHRQPNPILIPQRVRRHRRPVDQQVTASQAHRSAAHTTGIEAGRLRELNATQAWCSVHREARGLISQGGNHLT